MTGVSSYRVFTDEAKRFRVKQFERAHRSPGVSATEFAKDIGVDKARFYRWCREFGVKLK